MSIPPCPPHPQRRHRSGRQLHGFQPNGSLLASVGNAPDYMLTLWDWRQEQVVSASKWGNMLVWDRGGIKVEVCRKEERTCHTGTIQQFILVQSEP
ncbi:hypothetical protein NHX12_021360, partial [Muraenolepis orangiensis]